MSADVLMERRWDEPLSESTLFKVFGASSDCLAMHRCEWQSSLLSTSGHDLICHFRCPDAESLRIAMHQAGSPRGRVWAGTVHDAPDCGDAALAQANVLVTRSFDQPVRFEDLQGLEDEAQDCLQMHRVRFVRSFLSIDGRRMLCLYRAPDAESVRIAQQRASMPLERVLAVRRYAP
jgi:hypothetical protein